MFKVPQPAVGDMFNVWERCVTLMRSTAAPQRAAHLFKNITGTYPRNLSDYHQVDNIAVTRGVDSK